MENRVKQEESISLVRHCFIANLTTTSSAVRGCRWLVWGQEIPQHAQLALWNMCMLNLQLFIQRCNAKVPGTNQESSLVRMDKHDLIRPFTFITLNAITA